MQRCGAERGAGEVAAAEPRPGEIRLGEVGFTQRQVHELQARQHGSAEGHSTPLPPSYRHVSQGAVDEAARVELAAPSVAPTNGVRRKSHATNADPMCDEALSLRR